MRATETVKPLSSLELLACEKLLALPIKWPIQQKDLLFWMADVVGEQGQETALKTVDLIDALVIKGALERYSEFWISPRVDLKQLCKERKQPERDALPDKWQVVMVALLHIQVQELPDNEMVLQAIVTWLMTKSERNILDEREINGILEFLKERKWIEPDCSFTRRGRVVAKVWESRIKKSPEDW